MRTYAAVHLLGGNSDVVIILIFCLFSLARTNRRLSHGPPVHDVQKNEGDRPSHSTLNEDDV